MEQVERQKRREAAAIEEGLARYKRRQAEDLARYKRRQAGSSPAQSQLGYVSPLAKAIRTAQEEFGQNTGQPGRMPEYALALLSLDPHKLALMTLESIISLAATIGAAGEEMTAAHAALVLGKRCRLELYLDRLHGRARDVYDLVFKRNKDASNAQSRAQAMAQKIDAWVGGQLGDEGDRALGAKLIALAIEHTGLVKQDKGANKGSEGHPKKPTIVRLTSDVQESLALPVHLPMIVRPRPWTGLCEGGYLTIPTELVKHHNNQAIITALEAAELSQVLAAVNALQETPWRINKRLYDIMRSAWGEGKTVGGLPSPQPSPQRAPPPEMTPSESLDQAKELLQRSCSEASLQALLKGRRFRDYVTVRTCAGLFSALEQYGTLDHTDVVERTMACLALPPDAYAREGESSGSPSHSHEAALRRLVEYRLYEDLRGGGWRSTLPDLERWGLVRIEYQGLTAICRDEHCWSHHDLLRQLSAGQREHVAMELLTYMQENLALDTECFQAHRQAQLRKQVRDALKAPWTFGKGENLQPATVFVYPESHAEYGNEKSLSERSHVGRFLRRYSGWGCSRPLTKDEYIPLIRAVLAVLQRGGLIREVTIAGGHPGFQVRAERLRWVWGNGSPPQPNPRRSPRPWRPPAEAKAVSDRVMMRIRMDVCKELVDEPCLYFPYQLDYRGRAYPIPQVLNPQADDIGRALLQYAQGKPLGKSGAYWLAVHLANTYGYDKASFDERVTWVEEHEAAIRDSAEHPLHGGLFWADENKVAQPWCFLAACLEWVDYLNHHRSPDFASHLPIAMDGTCNGMQHLSAMGRDQVGGRATNLVRGPKPADIYQEVANRVLPRVQSDVEAGNEEARYWLAQLTGPHGRKVVKRATMTTPYGVTPAGIREQLIEDGFTADLADLAARRIVAEYLTSVLTEGIGQVVVQGKQIMSWLQQIAGTLAQNDRGVCWTTPVGFPVVVEHRKYKERRIRTALGRLQVYDPETPLQLQSMRQKSTIAPNFVHSLDAAHMMLTVNRLHQEGLCHFAMIHDSYGVHACDVDRMHTVLREEFVRIYKEPVLAQFLAEQCKANPGIQLPKTPPAQGQLALEEVQHSAYFFS